MADNADNANNTLTAESRAIVGSRPAGRLRREGKVPAVMYGLETDTTNLTVPGRELTHILADNCAIVLNGKTDGKLSQLRPDERLLFNYDTINGVNVVNRIAPAPVEEQHDSLTTTTPGYPTGF